MRWALLLLVLATVSCGRASGQESPEKVAPSKVENAVKEGQLSTVTLTAKAKERLGVVTVPVERRTVPRVRRLGGIVVAPPGAHVTLSAPLAGLLQPLDDAVRTGISVKRGEPLIDLLPLVAPESRVQLAAELARVDGAGMQAKVKLEAAKIVLARAEKLLADKAGSQRDVDDAKAGVALADASLAAAQAEKAALEKALGNLEAGVAAPLPITSPFDGVLMKIHAGPGLHVPAGGPLYEILDVSKVWVRVPVYVGEVSGLNLEAEVRVGPLSARPKDPGKTARPVEAPPTADPAASSRDLFYEVEEGPGEWRPGQRVAVTLPMIVPEESLVVPWSAVLYDFLGGEWVYEETEDRVYVRRAIEVLHVVGKDAVLSRGPQPGTKVVTDGVMEIFGTEFPTWK